MNLAWLVELVQKLLPSISPNIRAALISALDSLAEKAKTTPNPYDDIVILVVRSIIGL